MRQKSAKEKNFKYYDAKIQDDIYYKTLIGTMCSNYRKNFTEILDAVNTELSINLNRDSLLKNIRTIKSIYGERIYTHLINIFNYSISKQIGNIEKTREYKEKVERYIENENKRKNYGKSINKSIDHGSIISKLNKNIDIVLKNKKSISELFKEGLIDDKDLCTKAKRYIDEIGYEKYVDVNIAHNQVHPIDLSSYEEDNFTLDFFINNLKKTRDRLLSIDLDNKTKEELDQIRKMLDNIIVLDVDKEKGKDDRIKVIYHNKLRKVERLLSAFENMQNNIMKIKENPNIEQIQRNSNDMFLYQVKDEDIKSIKDVYSNYKNILNVRKTLLNLETSDNSKIETVREIYDNKMLKFIKNN